MKVKLDLELYAVINSEGKFFRSKGYRGGGKSWVDKINDAKIYTKKSPALGQITWWSKNYPRNLRHRLFQ